MGDGWLPVAGKTVECPADGTGKYKKRDRSDSNHKRAQRVLAAGGGK
jgi:hypothetical protein